MYQGNKTQIYAVEAVTKPGTSRKNYAHKHEAAAAEFGKAGKAREATEDGESAQPQRQERRAYSSRPPAQNPEEENATPSSGSRTYAAVAVAKPIQSTASHG